jgi:hypothetical protein
MNQFNKFCEDNKYEVIKIDGDGHCLITASLLLYNLQSESNQKLDEFIKKIEEYCIINKKILAQFTTMSAHKITTNINKYLKNKEWQNDVIDLMPIIISNVLNLNLKIYKILSNGNFFETDTSTDENLNTIRLVLNNEHYSGKKITKYY